jgi:hypothetical protein
MLRMNRQGNPISACGRDATTPQRILRGALPRSGQGLPRSGELVRGRVQGVRVARGGRSGLVRGIRQRVHGFGRRGEGGQPPVHGLPP